MFCIVLRIVCVGSDSSGFIESVGAIVTGVVELDIVSFIVPLKSDSP
jgi:hypothetical protein